MTRHVCGTPLALRVAGDGARRRYTEKYFACGLSTTIALVDCSGCSWNSSDSDKPIRSAPSSDRIGAWSSSLRARRIAERIARAAIALRQHLLHVAVVLAGEAQFGTDALVHVLRHRLRHLHRQAVQVEIVLVAVVLEPGAGDLGRLLPHGDDLQRDHVAFGVVDVAEEVGDAFAVLLRLARQGEAGEFRAAVRRRR